MDSLCALVIGHKKSSPGAINENHNLNEVDFNEDLALRIEREGIETNIQRVYRRTHELLPNDINLLDPNFIISLHCNAFNKEVSGTEVLYYHKSDMGKRIAELLQKNLKDFLKLSDRGIKPKTVEDRGGYLLKYTKAPCVIAEPFFLDNDGDLELVQANIEGLAETYAKSLDEISQMIQESSMDD
jgi:N-acetylmuramoyl-L-alanine amidase